MTKPAVKICGMRDADNIQAIATLNPDYMGFICWRGSPRFVGEGYFLPEVPVAIKRVGVFVNQSLEEIAEWHEHLGCAVFQLHGDETPEFCASLKELLPDAAIWKAFAVGERMPSDEMRRFDGVIDAALLDTKSIERGGSGKAFPWALIEEYSGSWPLVLSGGLGVENLPRALELCRTHSSITTLDFNSRVEKSIGIKEERLIRDIIAAISGA